MAKSSKDWYNFINSKTPRSKRIDKNKWISGYGVEYTDKDKEKFELMEKKAKSINKLMDNLSNTLQENGFATYGDFVNHIDYGQVNKIRSKAGFDNTLSAIEKELKNISTRGTGAQKAHKVNFISYIKNNFADGELRSKALRYINSLSSMELDMLRSVREEFSLRFNYETEVGGNLHDIVKELEKYKGITFDEKGKKIVNKNSPQSLVINQIAKHNASFNRIGKKRKSKSKGKSKKKK